MDFLFLFSGLLLPWLGGYLWVAALGSRRGSPRPPVTLSLGYGFFAGYAALALVLYASQGVQGRLSYGTVIAVMAAIALAGLAFYWRIGTSGRHPPAWREDPPLSPGLKLLCLLLFTATACHILLGLWENLLRPVYPWDAWATWVYRAKAWFYSDRIFELAGSTPMDGNALNAYYIEAHSYPPFASLLPLWVASCLGYWSETLVSLPTSLCGLALACALYGNCRARGIPLVYALAAVYLLVSIPLLGSHLSLAGYADVWMAGYVGLGFILLIRGLSENRTGLLVAGLSMIAFSIWIKNEGVVWLCVALATALIHQLRPARGLGLVLSMLFIASLLWLLGITSMEVPELGLVGFRDGAIHLPGLGSLPLALNNIGHSYINCFYLHGSWHLLWFLLAGLLLCLPFMPDRRMAWILATVMLLFAGSQLLIFGVTAHGSWAENYTAVNRLPLHLLPAMIFCLLLAWQAVSDHGKERGREQGKKCRPLLQLAPMAISLLIIGLLTSAYLRYTHPNGQGTALQLTAGKLNIVMGGGRFTDGELLLDSFENGYAMVSAAQLEVDAKSLPFLRYRADANTGEPPQFFWRLATQPEKLFTASIDIGGSGLIYLGDESDWAGTVSEIGLAIPGAPEVTARISSIELLPGSMGTMLEAAWNDWTAFEPWSQRSVNYLEGGRPEPVLRMPLVAGAWLLLTALVGARMSGAPRQWLPRLGLCLLAAWMVLDLRWLHNRVVQADRTLQLARLQSPISHIEAGHDQTIAHVAARVRSLSFDAQVPRILVASPEGNRFSAYRAKYHLLPFAARIYLGTPPAAAAADVDAILIIHQSGKPTAAGHLADTLGPNAQILWHEPESSLIRLDKEDGNRGRPSAR